MSLNLSVDGMSVFLAVPVNRDFSWQTENSMVATVAALKDRRVPYTRQLLVGSSIVETARSNLVHTFLKSGMNRLFWIDSDMAWSAEDFMRILALTSKMSVVGAAYPAKRGPNVEFLMNLDGDRVETNEWGCVSVLGMGLGFTCVQRAVVEQLAEQAPKVRNDSGELIAQVFHCGLASEVMLHDILDFTGEVPVLKTPELVSKRARRALANALAGKDEVFVGEDMNFFQDARDIGHPTWCDPMVELGHVGSKEYRGRLMDAMKASG